MSVFYGVYPWILGNFSVCIKQAQAKMLTTTKLYLQQLVKLLKLYFESTQLMMKLKEQKNCSYIREKP